jgi:hypothetical protein
MKFGIFDNFGALNSAPVFRALIQGLDRLGLSHVSHDESADIAVIWSVLWAGRMYQNRAIWQKFRDSQRPVMVMEVGSLRRGRTWRMSINGTTARASWGQGFDADRPEKLGISLQPWRNQGQHVVIACQRTESLQWSGMPPTPDWIRSVITDLRSHTDRPILVRNHPRQRLKALPGVTLEIPRPIPASYDDYDWGRSLESAWCVINWNSGAAIQSVIAGVPAIVGSDSLAAPVSSTQLADVENLPRPDRRAWLERISHTEWTLDEISSGQAISRLLLDL